jgi:hypothetical protein
MRNLFTDFKKAYDSGVTYCTLKEFEETMKLIKACLNETYNKVCISKRMCDTFTTEVV